MDILMSNWSNVEFVPKTYIFPPESRPGKLEFPVCTDIPLIDLAHNNLDETIQQVIRACQDFGFFQVINHGVCENLLDDTMNIYKEFFKLPGEYKAKFYSNDIKRSCKIFSSTLSYDTEEVHYWRDTFTHRCHPLEEHIPSWPDKPTNYREVVSEYSIETRKLFNKILDMICKGLVLKSGYFEGELSKTHLISVNHHIPCPNPSLTLGMPVHSDPNLITMLQQGEVPGLQILKDGKWIGVKHIPHTLILIPGLQLKVINHGVCENLMNDTMNIYKEFFKLPGEYKAQFYSNDINKSCRLCSSTLAYDTEEFHYWRDNFTHHCYPLEEYIMTWPNKPTKYREVVSEYSIETRKLLYKILDVICKGLELEKGYFEGEVSKTNVISVNHHIPCPNPSLTLGMPVHSDPNLITLLQQCDVPGLQILKDGKWIGVHPIPHAIVVIPGLQLKVISNDKFITPVHRVVTHVKEARTTIGVFLSPSPKFLIKPATALVHTEPEFRVFTYPEFLKAFTVEAKCDAQFALNHFRNKT